VFRPSLFWDVRRRRLLVGYQEASWTAGHLKVGPIGCPETAEGNNQPMPRNIPDG
jgi:hypothetical protein